MKKIVATLIAAAAIMSGIAALPLLGVPSSQSSYQSVVAPTATGPRPTRMDAAQARYDQTLLRWRRMGCDVDLAARLRGEG